MNNTELYYEVRGSGPLVVLVGAPMGADSFAPLAELLADGYSVLTTDPRGINRSRFTDGGTSTPEQRADDLAWLIREVDRGPAVAFGSSGGAVSVLALAQNHPETVHKVIAHEPPLDRLVPDSDELLAKSEKLMADYLNGDPVGAWEQFFALANIQLPPGMAQAMFGGERRMMTPPQQLADERFWFEHEMRESISWQPDIAKLTKVIVGIGEDSKGQLCDRTSTALADLLGIEPTRFPGGHTGFADDPKTFEPALRRQLVEMDFHPGA